MKLKTTNNTEKKMKNCKNELLIIYLCKFNHTYFWQTCISTVATWWWWIKKVLKANVWNRWRGTCTIPIYQVYTAVLGDNMPCIYNVFIHCVANNHSYKPGQLKSIRFLRLSSVGSLPLAKSALHCYMYSIAQVHVCSVFPTFDSRA